MASIFDGMGSWLTGVFGESVSVTPPEGIRRSEEAIFREGPVLVLGGDGQEITTVIPTLKIDRIRGADLVPGGLVVRQNGDAYRCLSCQPTGSPGEDAFIAIQLERIDASA